MDRIRIHASRRRQLGRWFLGFILATAVGGLIATPVVVSRILHHGVANTGQPISTTASNANFGQSSVAIASAPLTSSATGAQVTAGACSDPSTLTLSWQRYAVSMGNDYYLWTVTNSGAPCTLIGYPSIVERNARGATAPASGVDNASGMSVSAATVAPTTSTASFWVDLERCDAQITTPTQSYIIAISFAGLSAPVTAAVPQAISDCSAPTVVVSPIMQGVATIPGFTTLSTPPDNKPVWSPPKSPGAKP